jgi:Major Facilitator Superfamily
MAVGVAFLWFLLYRNPEHHHRLSDEERAYIVGDEPVEQLPNPSMKAVLVKGQFWGIATARFLTEPAWQTFSYWIPLYMVTARGMDIKQFALFAWLPFLGADLGCILGGYLSPFFANRFRMSLVNSRIAGIGAFCMIGPGLIGLVSSPITAILLFSVGGFAHPMLSGPALRPRDRYLREAGRCDGDRVHRHGRIFRRLGVLAGDRPAGEHDRLRAPVRLSLRVRPRGVLGGADGARAVGTQGCEHHPCGDRRRLTAQDGKRT